MWNSPKPAKPNRKKVAKSHQIYLRFYSQIVGKTQQKYRVHLQPISQSGPKEKFKFKNIPWQKTRMHKVDFQSKKTLIRLLIGEHIILTV